MPELIPLIEAVKSVGLPIGICVITFYLLNKERETHKEELKEITKAVNNNTIVQEKILTLLSMKGEHHINEHEFE